MADLVTDSVNDLIAKIEQVAAVRARVVYMYEENDIYDAKKKLNYPCLGVIYAGLTLNEAGTRRERSHNLLCTILLLGADLCVHDASTKMPDATALLDDIRTAVRTTTGVDEMKWRFESETPIDLSTDDNPAQLGYVQRWSRNVILT